MDELCELGEGDFKEPSSVRGARDEPLGDSGDYSRSTGTASEEAVEK